MKTAEEVARALGGGKQVKTGDGSWSTMCPAHIDQRNSLSLSDKDGKLLFKCHAGCEQTKVIAALKAAKLWDDKEIWTPRAVAPHDKIPLEVKDARFGEAVGKWVYRNENNQIVGFICRFNVNDGSKTYKPYSFCDSSHGRVGWYPKAFKQYRPVYNTPGLINHPDQQVLIVEGEKTADAAQKLFPDMVVITWAGGANAIKQTKWQLLKNRNVVIWPDNDIPGRKAANDIATILIHEKVSTVSIVTVPKGIPPKWDLADEIPKNVDMNPRELIAGAMTFEVGADDDVIKMNREFALILMGDKSIILNEYDDGEKLDIKYLSPSAFRMYFGNKFVQVGRKLVPLPTHWLTHPKRRSYMGIKFAPKQQVNGHYNLWRGFAYDPDPTGNCDLLIKHVLENVANGDEKIFNWVMGWFAEIIQNPDRKSGTSLAITGKMGTGKTILGLMVGALFPDHYTLVEDSDQVIGKFNFHMAKTLLLHADEAFWAGNPQHVGKLRGMVTGKTHWIEQKGKDRFEVDNYMRLLITTNEDWVVPAGFEERRFCVLQIGNAKMQDVQFFTDMFKQMEEERGYAKLLYVLQTFDLKKVNLYDIPRTKALEEQKMFSTDSLTRYWKDRLVDGQVLHDGTVEWTPKIAKSRIYDDYVDWCIKVGERKRFEPAVFGKKLKGLLGGKLDICRLGGAGRPWAYSLPSLKKSRQLFEEATKTDIDWLVEPEQLNIPEKPKSKKRTRVAVNDEKNPI